nr:hypothetical protein [Cytobacillus solani]
MTQDTPGSLQMINNMKNLYQDKVLVGTGTVLDDTFAKSAIDVGSDFIYSPIFDIKTIQITNCFVKISIPGVLTPT